MAWHQWIQVVMGLVSLAALVGSGIVAWLIAVRYRIPHLEARVKALEEINTGELRTGVHKHEIYEQNGKPLYMHRTECLTAQSECSKDRATQISQISYEFKAVRAQLDAMEEARARARVQMISFMAAVKEKLSLKFTIPEE